MFRKHISNPCEEMGQVPRKIFGEFNPYEKTGGSFVAIADDGFALIAADTSLTTGGTVYTRNQNKLCEMSSTAAFGSTGCWCDTLFFTSLVMRHMSRYEYDHRTTMSTEAIADAVSIMLNNKRFFPRNVLNILAGLDKNKRGIVYLFDHRGYCQRHSYLVVGSAKSMMQPILDRKLGDEAKRLHNQPMTLERALLIAKDAFAFAAKRQNGTGDRLILYIVTRDGATMEEEQLRRT